MQDDIWHYYEQITSEPTEILDSGQIPNLHHSKDSLQPFSQSLGSWHVKYFYFFQRTITRLHPVPLFWFYYREMIYKRTSIPSAPPPAPPTSPSKHKSEYSCYQSLLEWMVMKVISEIREIVTSSNARTTSLQSPSPRFDHYDECWISLACFPGGEEGRERHTIR